MQQDREREGGMVVLLLVAGLVVLFGGGYAAAYALAGENLPRGTTVADVEVGGRTPSAAASLLEEALGERATAPIPVVVDGRRLQVDPVAAGLSVDYAASVEAAGGERSWAPERLWDYYTGGDDLEPVLEVDQAALLATLAELDERVGTPPRDGDVVFEDDAVRAIPAVTGRALDPAQAAGALEAAYLRDDAVAELTLVPSTPSVDDADVQEALDSFANRAVSGPVTLVFDDTEVRLLPRDYAVALDVRAEDGELVPALKEQRLLRLVDAGVSRDGDPVDATFRIVDGEPRVVPARPGVRYQPDDVTRAFLELVQRPADDRRARVPARVAAPDLTTKEARALGVVERVSTFTTYYPHADYRNTNIGRAAELVDGTLLQPDDVFSLNGIVGERTRENGFTDGFIISDGIFKEDLGGGVSQMATTTFNAMFFAGLEDVEHKPHSFYIDRYPVGREATVAWGSVDLRFRNDTPYGVFVTAKVTPSTLTRSGVVTVSMYSTKVWDITSRTSERYNSRPEDTRVLSTRDCYPNDGYPGFDVDVTRVFRAAGERKVDHTETFHTSYLPSDTVICR